MRNRALHSLDGAINDLLLGHSQLEFTVNGARRKKDVNASLMRFLQCLPSAVDISVVASSQSADNRATNGCRNLAYGLEIPW